MMAHTVVHVAGTPADQAPETDVTMTSQQWRVGFVAEQAASKYQRIWPVSAAADPSLYFVQATTVSGTQRRAGFTPAGATGFRGVHVTEEVR
jgi:hypothetical protein